MMVLMTLRSKAWNGLGSRESFSPSHQGAAVSGLDLLNLVDLYVRNCNLRALLGLLAICMLSIAISVLSIAISVLSVAVSVLTVTLGLSLRACSFCRIALSTFACWLLSASLLQNDNYKLSVYDLRAFALLCFFLAVFVLTVAVSMLAVAVSMLSIAVSMLTFAISVLTVAVCMLAVALGLSLRACCFGRIALRLFTLALRLFWRSRDVLVSNKDGLYLLSFYLERICRNALCRNSLCILYNYSCRLSVRTCNHCGYALRFS